MEFIKEKRKIGAVLFKKFLDTSRSEKVLWILFYGTSFQLAFLFPYISFIPGERTKVFSGLLCASSLTAVLIKKRNNFSPESYEVIVSILLAGLAILSGVFSEVPRQAFTRAFVVAGSGLGGYWCSRLLLNDRSSREFYQWFCLVMLTGILLLSLGSYCLKGVTTYALDIHKHELNGMIIILSFAPLAFVYDKNRDRVVTGILLLIISYMVIALSFDPLIWFPPILCLLVFLLKPKTTVQAKYPLIVLAAILLVFAVYFHMNHIPARFGKKHDISTWVRIENYFFSFHIAKQHPFFGIGLTAPRTRYLSDYDIKYPYLMKRKFRLALSENRSSENQFLTFMCDVGFPFFLIYTIVTLNLFVKLFKAVREGDCVTPFHPVVLFVPATGALLHLLFNDGLMQPQLCWYYHLLLGMILPVRSENT